MQRIILMLSSVILILYGWITKNQFISIIGAIVFICALFINLYKTYLLSKEFKNRKDEEEISVQEKDNTTSKIERGLEGTITIASLIGTLAFQDAERIYFYPPLIIWVGIVVIYFISGIVIREVANIPLRMSYGGWKIYYPKKRKRI
jgi:Ca2+/Na+ antiporter